MASPLLFDLVDGNGLFPECTREHVRARPTRAAGEAALRPCIAARFGYARHPELMGPARKSGHA
mgnify:CR=1 FL=1